MRLLLRVALTLLFGLPALLALAVLLAIEAVRDEAANR